MSSQLPSYRVNLTSSCLPEKHPLHLGQEEQDLVLREVETLLQVLHQGFELDWIQELAGILQSAEQFWKTWIEIKLCRRISQLGTFRFFCPNGSSQESTWNFRGESVKFRVLIIFLEEVQYDGLNLIQRPQLLFASRCENHNSAGDLELPNMSSSSVVVACGNRETTGNHSRQHGFAFRFYEQLLPTTSISLSGWLTPWPWFQRDSRTLADCPWPCLPAICWKATRKTFKVPGCMLGSSQFHHPDCLKVACEKAFVQKRVYRPRFAYQIFHNTISIWIWYQ